MPWAAAIPLLGKLLKAAPVVWSLYNSLKPWQQKPPTQGSGNADDIPTSHTDVTVPQERPSTVEAEVAELQKNLGTVEAEVAELQKHRGTIEADVTELQERLGTVETNEETQAELFGRMIRHEEALLRGLIVLMLTSVVTGAVAIAALVIAVL